MSDTHFLILVLLVSAIAAATLAIGIARIRPGWSRRRASLVAAAPLPLVLAIISLPSIVGAGATRDAAQDTHRGEAAAFATIGLGLAMAMYLVGCVASWISWRGRG